MEGKNGKYDHRLSIVAVCKEMGWTYEEYLMTPQWFIDILSIMKGVEAHHQKMAMKK